MRYLFVFPKPLPRSLFESQLKPIITYLNRRGNDCFVYFGDKTEYQLTGDDFETVFSIASLRDKIKSIDYLYLRNVYDFLQMYPIKLIYGSKTKIIYDFRGFSAYESFYVHNKYSRYLILLLIEFVIYKTADYVTVVSNEFKYQLQKHFGLRKNIQILPCCINKNYLISNKIKTNRVNLSFVYSGGMQKWQKFQEILDLFSKIQSRYPSSTLHVFTQDLDIAKKIIEGKRIDKISIRSMEHSDLIVELRKYKFAFLLRDDKMINNVASPIKFAEYISAGLVPIVSPNIGDYSNIVERERIGIVTNTSFDIEDLNKLFDLDYHKTQKRMRLISETLTWEYSLPNIYVYNQ